MQKIGLIGFLLLGVGSLLIPIRDATTLEEGNSCGEVRRFVRLDDGPRRYDQTITQPGSAGCVDSHYWDAQMIGERYLTLWQWLRLRPVGPPSR